MADNNKSALTKQPSQMEQLLNQLDGEVSRYYNGLNLVRSSRLSIQGAEPSVSGSENISKDIAYQPGILYRFATLVQRLSELNNDIETEAKYLQDYL